MRLITLLLATILSISACTGSRSSPSAPSVPPAAATATAPTATAAPATTATAAATAAPASTPAAATGAPASAAPSAPPTAVPAPTPAASAAPSAVASTAPTAAPSEGSPTSATWTKLRPPTGPDPREDHTWTVAEDGATAYLFGGRAGGTLHDDLWAYDLASDTWTELAPGAGPAARFGHEAVWLPGRGLVIFAGQAGSTFFNDLWLYDPAAATWSELPAAGDVPVARYGSCAALGPDGRLWISHGFTEDGVRFSDTRAYDFASGTWSDQTPEGSRPVERCLHGCWFDATGSLVLFGGQTTGVIALGDLWVLASPGGDGAAWAQLDGEIPSARNLYAHAWANTDRIVFGGRGKDGYLGDLWAFDLLTDARRELTVTGDGPPPRNGAELVHDAARGRLLLFGGKHDGGTFQDLWQLALE